ncbi:transposase [Nitrospinota bacterium]
MPCGGTKVGRFDRFRSSKHLFRFCGLSPRNASSGARQAESGLAKAGNTQLRASPLQAAHHLIRCDGRWSQLALKMREAGTPTSVIVAAVCNRWIR